MKGIVFLIIICLIGLSTIFFSFQSYLKTELKGRLLHTIGFGIVLLSLPSLSLEIEFLPYLLIILGWVIIIIGDGIIATYNKLLIKKFSRLIVGILFVIIGIIGEVFNFYSPLCPYPLFHVYWTIIFIGGIIEIFFFISSKKV